MPGGGTHQHTIARSLVSICRLLTQNGLWLAGEHVFKKNGRSADIPRAGCLLDINQTATRAPRGDASLACVWCV